ncbi:MAG TPA: hypothetical protein DD727_01100 [Clostridiales bacterium]|nr:hypothetical protein [Clostridiales bacterium]
MAGILSIFLKNVFTSGRHRLKSHEFKDMLGGSRGHIEFDLFQCDFCGKCRQICVTGAIRTDRQSRFLQHDSFACLGCGECARICPFHCIRMHPEEALPALRRAPDVYKS